MSFAPPVFNSRTDRSGIDMQKAGKLHLFLPLDKTIPHQFLAPQWGGNSLHLNLLIFTNVIEDSLVSVPVPLLFRSKHGPRPVRR